MKPFVLILTLCACAAVGQAQPRTFIYDPQVVEGVRSAIQSGSKEYAAALKALRSAAENELATRPVSVVEKKQLPPSGDKHDYMSFGKYWWPDPAAKDGRPYIRRDGEVNPEVNDFPDDKNLGRMLRAVTTLSYASYFLGDRRYADQAAVVLRVWFLDSLTRMNPNLNFAQAVPGRNDGRGAGIVDAHQLPKLVDALGMLEESPSLTRQDREGLQAWFRAYLRWLRESKNGKQEAQAKNNHGCWYDVQVVSVALYVGDRDLARNVLTQSREVRIARQIEPDGTQPMELARTRSFGYSMFNLEAMAQLALMGERIGVDLWQFETKDGRGIRTALDFLLPYIFGEKRWERQQIVDVKLNPMYPLLLEAARAYKEKKYADAAARIPDAQKLSQSTALYLGRR